MNWKVIKKETENAERVKREKSITQYQHWQSDFAITAYRKPDNMTNNSFHYMIQRCLQLATDSVCCRTLQQLSRQ